MRNQLEALLHDIDALMPFEVGDDPYNWGRKDALDEVASRIKKLIAKEAA